MQNNIAFTTPEIVLLSAGLISVIYAIGSALFSIFRERQQREMQQIHWFRQPKLMRKISLSLFAFVLALIMIIDALAMRYHLNSFIIFLISSLGIISILLCAFMMINYSEKSDS